METAITNGIKVSIEVFFQPSYSTKQQYIFSYRITIQNNSKNEVQLLNRYWLITEGTGLKREVKGRGVVGEQPILRPNETYNYESWCPLNQELGRMQGSYTMRTLADGEIFEVQVPVTILASSGILN